MVPDSAYPVAYQHPRGGRRSLQLTVMVWTDRLGMKLLEHGSGGSTQRVFLPYSMVLMGALGMCWPRSARRSELAFHQFRRRARPIQSAR